MDAVVRLVIVFALVGAFHSARLAEAADDAVTTEAYGNYDLNSNETCFIFGGPSCATEIPDLYNSCTCPDGSGDRCECVIFYQCDNSTGAYDEDGKGLLDIRKRDGCGAVELKCCKIDAPPGKRSPPEPHSQFPLPKPPRLDACGARNPGGIASKIVNNEESEAGFGEFPWMVAVLLKARTADGADQLKCGGGLLSSKVVITAAHCVKGVAVGRLRVRAGEWDRESTSELYKHQDRDVGKVVLHDKYYGGNYRYDVALLVLEQPVELGYHIGTVCLPDAGDGTAFDGRRCTVSGWGKDKLEDRWPHRYLKLLDLSVIPKDVCERQLQATMLGTDYRLNESFICAGGEEGKDTCKGDGGSPLVCEDADGRYQVAGVVAWGVDCGRAGVPGLYANVPLVRTWIDGHLAGIV